MSKLLPGFKEGQQVGSWTFLATVGRNETYCVSDKAPTVLAVKTYLLDR